MIQTIASTNASSASNSGRSSRGAAAAPPPRHAFAFLAGTAAGRLARASGGDGVELDGRGGGVGRSEIGHEELLPLIRRLGDARRKAGQGYFSRPIRFVERHHGLGEASCFLAGGFRLERTQIGDEAACL